MHYFTINSLEHFKGIKVFLPTSVSYNTLQKTDGLRSGTVAWDVFFIILARIWSNYVVNFLKCLTKKPNLYSLS